MECLKRTASVVITVGVVVAVTPFAVSLILMSVYRDRREQMFSHLDRSL